ncbi:MAG: hypothetical protein AB1426_07655 [Bacillota bacterium]
MEQVLGGKLTIRQAAELLDLSKRQVKRLFLTPPSAAILNRILCLKYERKATQGSTVSFLGSTYQLIDLKGNVMPLRSRSKVVILKYLDGAFSALYKDKPFALQVFYPPPKTKKNCIKLRKRRYTE